MDSAVERSDDKIEIIGRYAGVLSLIEIGLGSVLHSFRVPLAGNFLALNQGYLLCRASLHAKQLKSGQHVAHLISNTAAVLKSLAPAGKKLGPMLSLSAQGFLFSIGTWIFGVNLTGLIAGMILLSLWTFIQPLLTAYLFFGDQLLSALIYFQKNLPFVRASFAILLGLFFLLVFIKLLLAAALGVLAWRTHGDALFQSRLLERARQLPVSVRTEHARGTAPLVLALRDLANPLFLISFVLTSTFLAFVENAWSQVVWLSLRPVAIAFLFFYVSRKINLRNFLKGRRSEFARVAERALKELEPPRS